VGRAVARHLETEPARQAPLALCPGDPDRARLAAAELLEGAQLVTRARGLLGFTGRYRGVPVTIQATGMGGASTAIVVQELVELGARALVRAGSAGALDPTLPLGGLVVAERAVADEGPALVLAGGRSAPAPDARLTDSLEAAARAGGRPVARGPIVSTELFYDPDPNRPERWRAEGLLAVEMEAATLFALAARLGVRAGCLLVVSDLVGGQAAERTLTPAGFQEAGLVVAQLALDGLVAGA
jgi:DeoD family purine-nucleoside phosphorylase